MSLDFLPEVRFAVRSLRATPGFAVLAVAILVIGVTAVVLQTAIIRGVFLNPLPIRGPGEIYELQWHDPEQQPVWPYYGLPLNDVPVWQAAQSSFGSTTAFGSAWAAIVQAGPVARRFTGCYVQGNFFAFLHARPLLGRTTVDDDNRPGLAPNVVLSHRLWQNEFGGRADIVGRTFPLNGKSATVVGVMGPEFTFPMNEDLWIPLYTQYAPHEQGNVFSPAVRTLGRLAPGVPLSTALAELKRVAVETAKHFPASNGRLTAAVIEPLRKTLIAPAIGRMIWLLLAAVVAVMILACVNVMNLLLARASLRHHELAVRVALGAPPRMLIGKGLAEGAVLAVVALGIGDVLAAFLIPWVWTWTQSTEYHLPAWMAFTIDWRVIVGADVFCGGCVLLAAIAPGLMVMRLPVLGALKASGRAATSRVATRVASLFIVLQVCLTVILLVWTSLVVRSVHNQLAAEWGYDLDSVLSARVGLFPSNYPTTEARTTVTEKILRELRGTPGISQAGVTDRFRMMLDPRIGLRPESGASADESTWPQVWIESVTDGYFATLRVVPIEGREFGYDEQWRNRTSVIVNASYARRSFAGRDPIGATIQLQGHPARTIIGVVPDTLMEGPGNAAVGGAGVFVPWTSSVTTSGTLFPTLVIRGEVRPEALERSLREAVARVDPGLAVYFVGTPKALVLEYLTADQIMTWLLGSFTALALLLAATGIFGLVSTSVSGRLREFAVRLALGAGAMHIAREVLSRNLRELGLGLSLGLAGALTSISVLARPLSGVLYRVSLFDLKHYVTVVVVILTTSLAASAFPIWRALNANPIDAMREE